MNDPLSPAASAAAQEALFCFKDALSTPDQGWVCTMRLLKSAVPTRVERDLFADDDEMRDLIEPVAGQTQLQSVRGMQRFYPTRDLLDVQDRLAGVNEAFLAQAVFDRKKRANVNVLAIQTLFVDIDCYNVNLTPKQAIEGAYERLRAIGIDDVPLTISSGRGIYIKMPLKQKVARKDIQHWSEVQRGLGVLLADIGADPKTKDPARVLRVIGSLNSKSQTPVSVLENAGASFDIDQIHSRLTDAKLMTPAAWRKARSRVRTLDQGEGVAVDREVVGTAAAQSAWLATPFDIKTRESAADRRTYSRFAWNALVDIDTLIAHRGGRVSAGLRDAYVFWSLVLLAQSNVVTPENFWREATALAARADGAYDPIMDGSLSSLYQRCCAKVSGNRNAVYIGSRERLLDELEITATEERQLAVLVSNAEMHRRRREARRATENLDSLRDHQKALLARMIHHMNQKTRMGHTGGFTAMALAEHLHIDVKTARKYLKLAMQTI